MVQHECIQCVHVKKHLLPISKHFLFSASAKCYVKPNSEVLKNAILELFHVK